MSDTNTVTYNWLIQIKGITPKLAKALVYHFDIEGKDCATQFISYAGLNTSRKAYNINQAKTIVYNLGDNLELISRKTGWSVDYLAKYTSKNNLISLIAKSPYNREVKLLMWKVGKSLSIQDPDESLYRKLYDDRVKKEIEEKFEQRDYAEAKALRYIEKIFLCHLFDEMYYVEYGKMPDRYNKPGKKNIEPEVQYCKSY